MVLRLGDVRITLPLGYVVVVFTEGDEISVVMSKLVGSFSAAAGFELLPEDTRRLRSAKYRSRSRKRHGR
jgi:hypothetical protein